MRPAALLAVLFVLANSSTTLAATKAIKFGRLVDGLGRVVTNAVVIVQDDRVQSVATGNPPIPNGVEVIDLSRYTGIPGLIDAHTHITYYWDGITTPRSEPPRHPAVRAFLAQENAHKALEAGVTTIRDLNAPDGVDLAMRDLVNIGRAPQAWGRRPQTAAVIAPSQRSRRRAASGTSSISVNPARRRASVHPSAVRKPGVGRSSGSVSTAW